MISLLGKRASMLSIALLNASGFPFIADFMTVLRSRWLGTDAAL